MNRRPSTNGQMGEVTSLAAERVEFFIDEIKALPPRHIVLDSQDINSSFRKHLVISHTSFSPLINHIGYSQDWIMDTGGMAGILDVDA